MARLMSLAATVSVFALAACNGYSLPGITEEAVAPEPPVETVEDTVEEQVEAELADPAVEAVVPMTADAEALKAAFDAIALQAALDAQPDEAKARYAARRPAATLEFFEIAPGMTVVETLPGGGWYTKILLPYLGEEGALIGAHYPDEIWSLFGFFDEEAIARRVANREAWPEQAAEWRGEGDAAIASTFATAMPEDATGTVDAVLFIRSLHNMNRFNAEAGYRDAALAETFRVLKPGGVVGVVQHRAPEGNPDEWADGSAGYLKEAALIAAFEAAGFVLEAKSELNANPKDQPTTEDVVWRLPPSLNGTEEGTPEREAVEAVGESDRMTLRFRKPA